MWVHLNGCGWHWFGIAKHHYHTLQDTNILQWGWCQSFEPVTNKYYALIYPRANCWVMSVQEYKVH